MNIRFEVYSDEVYYEPLNRTDASDSFSEFINIFDELYQSDNIKLDISLGFGIKYLDVLNI